MVLLKPGVGLHFVGIGGIGLSAIARVLHGRGFRVSGSDLQASSLTGALEMEGIPVFIGHRPDNLGDPDATPGLSRLVVVVSSAVPEDNPEVIEAKRRGVSVVGRQELLAELTAGFRTIAVAGTHGKTTTSAMIAWVLTEAGLEPSFIVGGVLQNLGSNARAGRGQDFVIEADEYDRAFLGLRSGIAIVTTLEHDHPDCYPTLDEMKGAFADFAHQITAGGLLIACRDDAGASQLANQFKHSLEDGSKGPGHRRVVTYGTSPGVEWQASNVRLEGSPTFEVRRGDDFLGVCALQIPGHHNVMNALAALACSHELGVEFGVAAGALTRFRGTERRFEVKGHAAGVTVVDDYAHHPTEIKATLAAARTRFPGQTIWAVFQPHTYSRTVALLESFSTAFCEADHVLVTSIYAAREQNSMGVSGADLVDRMLADGAFIPWSGPAGNGSQRKPDVQYVASLERVVDALTDRVRPGDVVITMGAGDGYVVGERVLEELLSREGGGSTGEGATPQEPVHSHARNSDQWLS